MKKILLIILITPIILLGQEKMRLSEVDKLSVTTSKYGLDTMKCEEHLSIYTEFYKQKSYESAFDSWLYLFMNAPKRTKNILGLSKMGKYRRILTGSPVTKSPLDLFTQCYFLDPYLLDHASYYSFRTRYAIMRTANFSGRSVQIVVGYHNLGELIRTQDLEPMYFENSSIYIFNRIKFLKINNRIGSNPKMFEMSKIESFDIDDMDDFFIAESLQKNLKK